MAFGAEVPVDAVWEAGLAKAAADVAATEAGDLDLVVLSGTPPMVADLRDAAQDLLLAGNADTVLIRTPQVAIGVSDTLTRAQVEVGERAMASAPDYVSGIHAFAAAADGVSVPWGTYGVMAFGLFLMVLGYTAITTQVKPYPLT